MEKFFSLFLNYFNVKIILCNQKKTFNGRNYPDGPVVKTQGTNAGDPGLITGQGTRSHML